MNFVGPDLAVALAMESLDEAFSFAIEGEMVFAMCCLRPWRVDRREVRGLYDRIARSREASNDARMKGLEVWESHGMRVSEVVGLFRCWNMTVCVCRWQRS